MKGLQLQLSYDDEFITVTGEYHLFEEERPFALDRSARECDAMIKSPRG
jgi:hypothetical protein